MLKIPYEIIYDSQNINISTFQDNLLCEASITNFSGVGDNEGGIVADDVMEEAGNPIMPKSSTFQFNPPEIEYNTDKESSVFLLRYDLVQSFLYENQIFYQKVSQQERNGHYKAVETVEEASVTRHYLAGILDAGTALEH